MVKYNEKGEFMRLIVAVLLSVMLGLGIAWGGDKEELLLKQRAIQAEMAAIETSFRLLPYQFKEKQAELQNVQQQLQALDASEKKGTEKPVTSIPSSEKKK